MGATESHWERDSSLSFFKPPLILEVFARPCHFAVPWRTFYKTWNSLLVRHWKSNFCFWLPKKYSFANHLLFSNVQIAINNSRFFSANLVTNKLLRMQKWKPFPFENSLSYAWLGEVRGKLASRCQAALLLHTNNDSEPGTDDPSGTFYILHQVHSWLSPGSGLTIWSVCVCVCPLILNYAISLAS